ncbi:MAG: Fic family protein [Parachlamydiaceae bacterium]|nr:Fic family protein [Parachlamydiaceae bacterium]
MDMVAQDSIVITSEILNLIAEIDEFKGAWQQMRNIAPDRLSALKKVASIESIGSSTRIEGAKLSNPQIETLLAKVNGNFKTRDEQEVAGYAFVCEQICTHFSSMPFTENMIRQLHLWLLQYSDKDERHRGEYKTIPINIEAFDSSGISIGVIFETVSPLKTPMKMQQLLQWTTKTLETMHPLIVIGVTIVLFLGIHPFQDGNGRLSRLLTTLLMLKNGYLYAPYSSLESFIEASNEEYYLALQRTQRAWQKNKPDWTTWLLFFLRSLQRQKRHLEVKLEREQILLKGLTPLNATILDLIAAHGPLSISQIALLTQANRNTIKKSLDKLLKEQYVFLVGAGRASRYAIQQKVF